jgi:hypothetical protein
MVVYILKSKSLIYKIKLNNKNDLIIYIKIK